MPRLLDLFSGRWGWSRAFAARGWHCVGIDLVAPPEIPENCHFIQADILNLEWQCDGFLCANDGYNTPVTDRIDFICASSPCEEFSVWGMANFHPNPEYPEFGIKLFNHTRAICEGSGLGYVMENVRPAEKFVGIADNHCGPFYLWGNAVPPILPQGIKKGFKMGTGTQARAFKERGDKRGLIEWRKKMDCWHASGSPKRIANTAKVATIPPELANCVADYAERLLEQKVTA